MSPNVEEIQWFVSETLKGFFVFDETLAIVSINSKGFFSLRDCLWGEFLGGASQSLSWVLLGLWNLDGMSVTGFELIWDGLKPPQNTRNWTIMEWFTFNSWLNKAACPNSRPFRVMESNTMPLCLFAQRCDFNWLVCWWEGIYRCIVPTGNSGRGNGFPADWRISRRLRIAWGTCCLAGYGQSQVVDWLSFVPLGENTHAVQFHHAVYFKTWLSYLFGAQTKSNFPPVVACWPKWKSF